MYLSICENSASTMNNNYYYNSDNEYPDDYSQVPSPQQSFTEEEIDDIVALLCEEELDPLLIQIDPLVVLQP